MVDFFGLMPIEIITIVAIIGGGSFAYIRNKRRFPVTVRIFEDRAGKGIKECGDRAGRFTDKRTGKTFYKLKKRKKLLPAINFNDLIPSDKSTVLYLHSTNPEDYVPMNIKGIDETTEIGAEFIAQRDREIARKMAHVQGVIDINTKFQNRGFLERYLPLIALVIFAFSVVLMLWATGQYFERVLGQLSGIVASLQQTMGTLQVVQSPPF
jgi:hypothetical protein